MIIIEVIQPQNTCYDTSGIINTEKVFVVFFDIVDNSAGDLYLRQQILISQYEKNLALGFILLTQDIMIGYCKILFLLLSSRNLIAILFGQITTAFLLRLRLHIAIVSVSKGKDIPIDLDYKKRKVDVSKIKIDEFQFGFTLNIIFLI